MHIITAMAIAMDNLAAQAARAAQAMEAWPAPRRAAPVGRSRSRNTVAGHRRAAAKRQRQQRARRLGHY